MKRSPMLGATSPVSSEMFINMVKDSGFPGVPAPAVVQLSNAVQKGQITPQAAVSAVKAIQEGATPSVVIPSIPTTNQSTGTGTQNFVSPSGAPPGGFLPGAGNEKPFYKNPLVIGGALLLAYFIFKK